MLIILCVFLFVFALLLIVPAVDTWRAERRKRRRGGMIP
jgi:hypothetical protein